MEKVRTQARELAFLVASARAEAEEKKKEPLNISKTNEYVEVVLNMLKAHLLDNMDRLESIVNDIRNPSVKITKSEMATLLEQSHSLLQSSVEIPMWLAGAERKGVLAHAKTVLQAYYDHEEKIIEILSAELHNWSIDRLAKLDRMLLLVAVAEICFVHEPTPSGAIINDIVNIAKKYCNDKSAGFINGTLRTIANKWEVRENPSK